MRRCRRTPRRPTTCSWRSSLRRGARCPSSSSRPTTARVCSPPPPLFVCGPSDGLRAPARPCRNQTRNLSNLFVAAAPAGSAPIVRAQRVCVAAGGNVLGGSSDVELGALLRRPTDGRLPGRVVCVGGNPPPVGVPHPLVVQRLWRLWRRLWRCDERCDGRCDAGAVDGAARRVWGRAGAERGAPQRRACGDGVAHGRSAPEPRAPRRPSRARAGGCARAVCVSFCLCIFSRVPVARGRGGRADRRAASAARPLRLVFAFGCCGSSNTS